MTSGGKDERGAVPDWYRLICAAEILHVPPWELLKQDAAWIELALSAKHAEQTAIEAKRTEAEHNARKKQRGKR